MGEHDFAKRTLILKPEHTYIYQSISFDPAKIRVKKYSLNIFVIFEILCLVYCFQSLSIRCYKRLT